MTPQKELELLQHEAEFARVDAARREMLLKIRERELDIERIRGSVQQQQGRMNELQILMDKILSEK